MYLIPTQRDPETMDLIIVLEDENNERIKQNDPLEVYTGSLTPQFRNLKIGMVAVCYASPADRAEIERLVKAGNLRALLQFLYRGWSKKPGDNDLPYIPYISAIGKN